MFLMKGNIMKKYFNIEVIESLALLAFLVLGFIYLSNTVNMEGSFMSIEEMNIQTMLFSHFHHFI